MYSIDEINIFSREKFIRVFGGVFEHSAWVAELAWDLRPFADARQLHHQMLRQIHAAGDEQILAFIREHPNLATRMKIDGYSVGEQQSAGLDCLSEAEYENFSRLNDAYMKKFAFPFILAVANRTKEEIREQMERRMGNSKEAELKEALRQIARITENRIDRLVSCEEVRRSCV